MEEDRHRGQVAGDGREPRPQTTDRLGGGEGRQKEGMRARRVRWTASNELRRNGKQSFLAWVAWLTLIERGWAGGDRGNKAKRKKRRRRKALPVNEQRLQGGEQSMLKLDIG